MVLSCSVYIVEDDEAVARSLIVLLQLCGYHPRRYESADALLAEAPDLPAGCLLIDYSLPGTDGLEAFQMLRRRGFDWPTILMTGHELGGIEREAKRAGVRCVLEKPFDTERLAVELEGMAAFLQFGVRQGAGGCAIGPARRPGQGPRCERRSLAEALSSRERSGRGIPQDSAPVSKSGVEAGLV